MRVCEQRIINEEGEEIDRIVILVPNSVDHKEVDEFFDELFDKLTENSFLSLFDALDEDDLPDGWMLPELDVTYRDVVSS